ncbi:MAG: hypothetical protein GC172_07265 [Phycisphaera sp.]|nr:hypothetical protein [Phycisphaera sp.]
MSVPRYIYTDPRGLRTGPFSEQELVRLAEIGGLEFSGFVELEGLAEVGGIPTRWRVSEVPWLRNELLRANRRTPRAVPSPTTEVHAAAMRASASAPTAERRMRPTPTAPDSAMPPMTTAPTPPAISRGLFVLLALLPAFVGIFGIHNLVAGYVARGTVQLVLSFLTLGSIFGTTVLPLCCCIGIPLWPVLFVWTLIEVIVVVRDARGVAFA